MVFLVARSIDRTPPFCWCEGAMYVKAFTFGVYFLVTAAYGPGLPSSAPTVIWGQADVNGDQARRLKMTQHDMAVRFAPRPLRHVQHRPLPRARTSRPGIAPVYSPRSNIGVPATRVPRSPRHAARSGDRRPACRGPAQAGRAASDRNRSGLRRRAVRARADRGTLGCSLPVELVTEDGTDRSVAEPADVDGACGGGIEGA
jgi:hypothetical protein